MMGMQVAPAQLFYNFCLDDHLLHRRKDKALPVHVSDRPRTFIVDVSAEAGEVVLRVALSLVVEYPSKASADP